MGNESAAAEEFSNVVPLRRRGTRRTPAPVTITQRPMVTISTITVLGKTRRHSFGLRPEVRLTTDQAPTVVGKLQRHGAISYNDQGELFVRLPDTQRWNTDRARQIAADARAILKQAAGER